MVYQRREYRFRVARDAKRNQKQSREKVVLEICDEEDTEELPDICSKPAHWSEEHFATVKEVYDTHLHRRGTQHLHIALTMLGYHTDRVPLEAFTSKRLLRLPDFVGALVNLEDTALIRGPDLLKEKLEDQGFTKGTLLSVLRAQGCQVTSSDLLCLGYAATPSASLNITDLANIINVSIDK